MNMSTIAHAKTNNEKYLFPITLIIMEQFLFAMTL